jgi:hypothetical protein
VQSIDLPAPADPAALQRVPTPEQVRTFLAEAAKAPAQPVIENVAGGTEQVLAAPDSTSSKVFEKKDGKKREIYKSTYKRKKKP